MFSLAALGDIILIAAVSGFVFSSLLWEKPARKHLLHPRYTGIAALIGTPAIVLHEFGHKLSAQLFGIEAAFHAAYQWLGISVLVKLLHPSLIFIIPAYVSIPGEVGHMETALVALAGPLVNGLLALISFLLARWLSQPRYYALSGYINLFLFAFNLLPLPGLDGFVALKHILYLLA